MGKLHTLRRAIEANPERWLIRRARDGAILNVHGASSHKQTPSSETFTWHPVIAYASQRPYRAFVRSVLRDLGYPV